MLQLWSLCCCMAAPKHGCNANVPECIQIVLFSHLRLSGRLLVNVQHLLLQPLRNCIRPIMAA